jgi:hypothetical protein
VSLIDVNMLTSGTLASRFFSWIQGESQRPVRIERFGANVSQLRFGRVWGMLEIPKITGAFVELEWRGDA